MQSLSKSYGFNRRPEAERPKGDFYETPRSLVWGMEDLIRLEFDISSAVLEPCCGGGAISSEFKRFGYKVVENDLYRGGSDYLRTPFSERYCITNPPFSLWDAFAEKAKKECEKVMFIGRLNYFGTVSRQVGGLWDNLKSVWFFNRYVDYRTPGREDGLFHVGAMLTGWFLWDRNFTGDPTLHVMDVQRWAKLGNFKG